MYSGNITEVQGITAAHMTDEKARTGCTVILAKEGAVGSVDVRGGGPGTRETDAFAANQSGAAGAWRMPKRRQCIWIGRSRRRNALFG